MKIVKINKTGIDFIKSFEGLRLNPYLCSAGVPTIGYGSTSYENGVRVTLGDPDITQERAENLLMNTLSTYEKGVDDYTTDSINQQQFNALVSFAYNLGVKALKSSTLLKLVNLNPNNPLIVDEFNKWVNANGRKISGLVKRRSAESKLYFSKA